MWPNACHPVLHGLTDKESTPLYRWPSRWPTQVLFNAIEHPIRLLACIARECSRRSTVLVHAGGWPHLNSEKRPWVAPMYLSTASSPWPQRSPSPPLPAAAGILSPTDLSLLRTAARAFPVRGTPVSARP